MTVVVAHICEAVQLSPWMGWAYKIAPVTIVISQALRLVSRCFRRISVARLLSERDFGDEPHMSPRVGQISVRGASDIAHHSQARRATPWA